MGDDNHADLEKWANDLDMKMLFINGRNSDDMQTDLNQVSAYSQDKYPQNIQVACNIYCTQYSKTNKSNNNSNEGNKKGQDKNNDDDNNDEKKDGLISAHISMDSVAAILAAHSLNDIMWEMTNDDNIGLLIGKKDLVCCHFDVPHLKKSEEE